MPVPALTKDVRTIFHEDIRLFYSNMGSFQERTLIQCIYISSEKPEQFKTFCPWCAMPVPALTKDVRAMFHEDNIRPAWQH